MQFSFTALYLIFCKFNLTQFFPFGLYCIFYLYVLFVELGKEGLVVQRQGKRNFSNIHSTVPQLQGLIEAWYLLHRIQPVSRPFINL